MELDLDALDPRWEWAQVRRLCDVEPRYIKGRCNHLEVAPVESGDAVVAGLCLTCDAQLPPALVTPDQA